MRGVSISDKEREYIRAHYLTDSARDIAAAIGRHVRTVYRWAWRLGVRHTPDTRARLLLKAREAHGRRPPEATEKARETLRRRRRKCMMQMLAGRKPDRQYRFAKMPVADYSRWYSLTRRGYLYVEGDWRTYWYDAGTRRTRMEGLLERRHGYRFLPDGDDGREEPQPDALTRAVTSTLGTVI